MNLRDILHQLGIVGDSIRGLKQGKGIVGKLTTIVLAAFITLIPFVILAAYMHSLAVLEIGATIILVFMLFGFAAILLTAHLFPLQSLEGL